MVILSQTIITQYLQTHLCDLIPVSFAVLDDGDAFALTDFRSVRTPARRTVEGAIKFVPESESNPIDDLPMGIDVLVMVSIKGTDDLANSSICDFRLDAYVRRRNGNVESCPVQVIQFQENAFSRIRGLYETDVLHAKTVLIIGLGSGGAPIAIELAKAGVGNFILVDHDRIAIENISRHPCGISDLGRFKTKAVRDLILDKNPFAHVETYEQEVNWNWLPRLRKLARRADLVFCCTDNRPSRVLVNLASVSENRVCIYGGTFRRAYGGQVLRVIPGQTMCYQCFIDTFVDDPADREISNEVEASQVVYSDRPVPVEPGLASDITPITIMCVKIGILEMLRGTETSLKSLYDDLSSPLFQWLNRREEGTDFAKLEPMDKGDSLRILAWYSIEGERNPGCPVCGDYIGTQLGKKVESRPSAEQIAAFAPSTEEISAEKLDSMPKPPYEEEQTQ